LPHYLAKTKCSDYKFAANYSNQSGRDVDKITYNVYFKCLVVSACPQHIACPATGSASVDILFNAVPNF